MHFSRTRNRPSLRYAGALVACFALTGGIMYAAQPAEAKAKPTPGTGPAHAASAALSGTSIAPFYSASGAVSLSTNAAGSNSGPVTRDIVKPAGATVRAAFLMAAGTGSSDYTPVDGDVTINGTPVDFDESTAVTNSIGSGNI